MLITRPGYVFIDVLMISVHMELSGIISQTHAFKDVLLVVMATGKLKTDTALKFVQLELMLIHYQ